MSNGILASRISQKVDRLFEVDHKKYRGQRCQIPVLGGSYVPGEDNIKPMKKLARAALLAREWFAIHGPADAPPLPLSMGRARKPEGWRAPAHRRLVRPVIVVPKLRCGGASVILRLRLRCDGIRIRSRFHKEGTPVEAFPAPPPRWAWTWPMLETARRARTHDGEFASLS